MDCCLTAPGILQMPELSNHQADSLQIKFIGTILACGCATSWSFAHQGHIGMLTGIITGLGALWMLELSNNHWADSLQIKFIGAVSACRCAMSWSFAHRAHMGVLMGNMVHGTLRTLELRDYWANLLQITVIYPSAHMGMLMGIIWVHGILQTQELSNPLADSLQIKFIGTVLALCTIY